MIRALARLLVVLAVCVTLTACLGPQMEVRVENESGTPVIVELTGNGQEVRSEVPASGGVEFRAADRGEWTLSVDGATVMDARTNPRAVGLTITVHIDESGAVNVGYAPEG